MELLKNMEDALQQGSDATVKETVENALKLGVPASKILNDGLIAGMSVVGKLFKEGELYIPEVLIAAKNMHAGMDILKPHLAKDGVKSIGKILLVTVKGDLHDIGKNIVGMLLVGAGFEVLDLGIDVPREKIVEAVKEHEPDILGLSALLTSTMMEMQGVIHSLKSSKLKKVPKVLIGGAPVTQQFADDIGADGYAADGVEAGVKSKVLIGIR
jgi:5-methyltetrahydrofolate--homocysteine methyltransferase